MPMPLPEGQQILVERKTFQPDYSMPSMEMATDHYTIGYILSGDRRTIMPSGSFSYHGGNVTALPPYIYHRTVSERQTPYERIMIKYSPAFVQPLIDRAGRQILDGIHDWKVIRFPAEKGEKIAAMFMDIAVEYERESPYRELILQGMLFRILVTVWEEGEAERGVIQHKTLLTPPIVDAISYIENFYYRNPSLEETAGAANFSAPYFSRLFHAQMGKSYSEYLNHVKLRHACILLAQTSLSVMEIAQETGFCHGNYLNEQFKRKMGMTPGQFRRRSAENRK